MLCGFMLWCVKDVGMLIADHLGGERKDAVSADMAAVASSSSAVKHLRAVEDSSMLLDMTVSLCGMAAKKVRSYTT